MDAADWQHDPNDVRATRERRLAVARTLAAALTLAAVALAIWALVWPVPYALVVALLVVLPALTVILALGKPTMFRIGLGASYAGANLAIASAVSACALLARALLDLNMIDWLPLIGMAAFVGGIFLAVTILAERTQRRRWLRLLAAAVLTGAYALGTLGQANSLLDPSAPAVLRSRVLDKTLGHVGITTHRLTLAPWGPLATANDVAVPRELYDKVALDDPVCVRLHDGALGMAWFTVTACR